MCRARLLHSLVAAAALIATATIAAADDRAAAPSKSSGPAKPSNEQLAIPEGANFVRAGGLIGTQLQTFEDKPAGKIEDIVVDLDAGRAVMLVLGAEPAGSGQRAATVLVPTAALHVDKDGNKVLHATAEQMASAPRREAQAQKSCTRDDLARALAQFEQADDKPDATTEAGGAGTFVALSALRKTQVQNARGTALGTVNDLALLPDGRIAYVAMASAEDAKRLYPVPLTAFVVLADRPAWVLELPAEILEQTPTFAITQWPKTIDRGWAEYVAVRYGNPVLGGVNRELHKDAVAPQR